MLQSIAPSTTKPLSSFCFQWSWRTRRFPPIPHSSKTRSGGSRTPRSSKRKMRISTVYQMTAERFWARVTRGNGCWLWTGPKVGRGYGKVNWRGKTARAHRVAWEITYGLIPDGMWVLHKCDNPACCRPNHLFLGTCADNVRDMCEKGRQAQGNRSGNHTHPERRPRGDAHYSRIRPEALARGEKHGNAKLTDADVREIRALYRTSNISIRALAHRFGVSTCPIYQIVRGNAWQHVIDEGGIAHDDNCRNL